MLWLHYAMFMCAASDSIRRPDFTAPKFKCGISWHFSAWMWAKTQEFGFNAVDTCWAIDIWNPFHPFSIHFPCRYFRTICAFSIFFTCFQWFSVIVTCCQKSKMLLRSAWFSWAPERKHHGCGIIYLRGVWQCHFHAATLLACRHWITDR